MIIIEFTHGEKAGLYEKELRLKVFNQLEKYDINEFWDNRMHYYNSTQLAEAVIYDLNIPEEQEEDIHFIVTDYMEFVELPIF